MLVTLFFCTKVAIVICLFQLTPILHIALLYPVHTQHDDGFFCNLVPRRISWFFCRFGFFFEMICPDNCELDLDRCEDECAADDGRFKCKKFSCRGCTFCEPTTAPTGPTPSPTERCREDCADFDGRLKCKRPTCQGCDSCNAYFSAD